MDVERYFKREKKSKERKSMREMRGGRGRGRGRGEEEGRATDGRIEGQLLINFLGENRRGDHLIIIYKNPWSG